MQQGLDDRLYDPLLPVRRGVEQRGIAVSVALVRVIVHRLEEHLDEFGASEDARGHERVLTASIRVADHGSISKEKPSDAHSPVLLFDHST